MKASTARQLTNATAARKGRAAWVVKASYTSASDLKPSAPMTYREALAVARITREACGYAVVESTA